MDKKNYEPVVFDLLYLKNDIVTFSNAANVKQDDFVEGEGMDDIFSD